jgi:hypothetical protein
MITIRTVTRRERSPASLGRPRAARQDATRTRPHLQGLKSVRLPNPPIMDDSDILRQNGNDRQTPIIARRVIRYGSLSSMCVRIKRSPGLACSIGGGWGLRRVMAGWVPPGCGMVVLRPGFGGWGFRVVAVQWLAGGSPRRLHMFSIVSARVPVGVAWQRAAEAGEWGRASWDVRCPFRAAGGAVAASLALASFRLRRGRRGGQRVLSLPEFRVYGFDELVYGSL